MPGLGTIINVTAIFAAGIMGMLFGARIPKRLQDSMIICSGIVPPPTSICSQYTASARLAQAAHFFVILCFLIPM